MEAAIAPARKYQVGGGLGFLQLAQLVNTFPYLDDRRASEHCSTPSRCESTSAAGTIPERQNDPRAIDCPYKRRTMEWNGVVMVKTRRIEARVDPESESRIIQAAAIARESVSSFMVRAARREADQVLARADVSLMPAEQFDALLESLDEPDSAPVLRKVASQTRTYARR